MKSHFLGYKKLMCNKIYNKIIFYRCFFKDFMIRSQYVLGVFLLSFTFPTWSQKNDDSSTMNEIASLKPTSFYIGGRLGWSHFQDSCGSDAQQCQDDKVGGGVYGGYQIYNWLAVEAGLTDYGKAEANYMTGDISAHTYGTELTTKISYSLSERWELYTRLGASYQNITKKSEWSGEQKGQDWNAIIAGGVDYRISQHWSLRGEYQFIDGIGDSNLLQSDLHFASLGLTYHFTQNEIEPNKGITTDVVVTSQVKAEPYKITLWGQAQFGFDSYDFKATEEQKQLIKSLTKYNTGMINITGHTDSQGAAIYNQILSKRRAQAVANYLVQQGVNPHMIIVMGMGEKQPLADNTTEVGRAKNRRVEINFKTEK
ncbi:OmpA family protein [Vibrio sp. S17_S38]|uniref:OmpA family protein n=1 Tax=Vibrio sp. S17_S38 TaxID=2720229 RepID=UPI00168107F9|nr:OmpA family protein [Vibrio sp. S17_S38]MBD1573178.1 OmpA family protein [Vibrio sp. S17_S38]